MKPRTVIVTLELVTTESLASLRNRNAWRYAAGDHIQQVTVHVAQPPKPKKGAKRGAK